MKRDFNRKDVGGFLGVIRGFVSVSLPSSTYNQAWVGLSGHEKKTKGWTIEPDTGIERILVIR
jgi:hypothetical protein